MSNLFAVEYIGQPFQIFSIPHLIALAGVLLLNLFFILNRKNFSANNRLTIRRTMAIVLIVNESAWHVWHLATHTWTVQEMLPFHLCSITVWGGAYMLWRKHQGFYEFAYLIGIAGALQALLTPDLGRYGYPHFRYFQTFISHGLIITSALYMTIVEGFRPYPRSIRNVLLYGNIYALLVTLLNFAIQSNYLFTAHKPPTASLLDVLPAWPAYLVIIEFLAVGFILLFYLPFWIKDLRSRRLKAPLADQGPSAAA